MKKLLVLLSLVILSGCMKDDIIGPMDEISEVPVGLEIYDLMGIKVQSMFVFDEVNINAKLPYDGTYRIKIRDIGNNLVSQEKITASMGDNILKVYVSSLPNDAYTLQLTDENHKVLGVANIIVNN
jgi:hypothetical protein